MERKRVGGREGEGEGERESEGQREGGYVTSVLIKLRCNTFTWMVRTCLPNLDQVRRVLKKKRE
jgi:hypothetical protein